VHQAHPGFGPQYDASLKFPGKGDLQPVTKNNSEVNAYTTVFALVKSPGSQVRFKVAVDVTIKDLGGNLKWHGTGATAFIALKGTSGAPVTDGTAEAKRVAGIDEQIQDLLAASKRLARARGSLDDEALRVALEYAKAPLNEALRAALHLLTSLQKYGDELNQAISVQLDRLRKEKADPDYAFSTLDAEEHPQIPLAKHRIDGADPSDEIMMAASVIPGADRKAAEEKLAQETAQLERAAAETSQVVEGNVAAAEDTLAAYRGSAGEVLDPTKINVFRGGTNLTFKANEIAIDKATGLVKTTRGISLSTDAASLTKFGGAKQIASLPDGLQIIQRGQNLTHFEVVLKVPVKPEEYQALLDLITFK